MPSITPLTSLTPLIEHYDAFIVDLWGVIHDGRERYPGVLEALSYLRSNNKKIIFLSNAPRRSSKAKKVLNQLGITENLYDKIITSGEVVFDIMMSNTLNLGKSFVIIGPDKDDDLLDDALHLNHVNDLTCANFIVATGFDHDDSVIDDIMPQLNEAIKHKLPMICANPDIEVVRQDGTRALCAGVIAQTYEKMGGHVICYGKPHQDVYHHCFNYFADIPLSRIAAIGDNLDTDIQGATQQKIDSYLIAGGILADIFNIQHGQLPNTLELEKYCSQKGIFPTGVLPAFLK